MSKPKTAVMEMPGQSWRVLAILGALMGFASISTDLYLPAIPTMAGALQAPSGSVELTIYSYLVGFSLGQVLWGPISDRHGRRLPIAAGLVLFVIGSAGCSLSSSVHALIGWRVVQAVGACASVVLARAMVRDLYAGARAAQMMSVLLTIMAVAPLLGPFGGGGILALAGWRAIFVALVGVGLLTLAALSILPETLPPARRRHESLTRSFAEYLQLLRNRSLLGYAGIGGLFYGASFGYIAASPSVYIRLYHVPPQFYGFLFGAGILGIMATSTANARFAPRFGSNRLLRWAVWTAAASGLALALTARTGWGGLAGLAVPVFVFVSMTGVIGPNAAAGALQDFPDRAGTASALFGAIQYGGGILGSALVGALEDGTAWPTGMIVALGGFGALLSLTLVSTKPMATPSP